MTKQGTRDSCEAGVSKLGREDYKAPDAACTQVIERLLSRIERSKFDRHRLSPAVEG